MTPKKDTGKQVLKYYWRHVRRYPKYTLGVIVSIPVTVLINGYLPPLIVANVLSRLSQQHYQGTDVWANFGPSLAAYGSLLLVGVAAWRIADHFAWKLEQNIVRDIAEEVFDTMLKQTADFHANHFAGSLVSQANKAISGYVRIADTTIFQVLPLFVGIVIASIVMAVRAPLFAALLLLFSASFVFVAFKASRPTRMAGARYASAESRQTGYLADAITNIMAIKSFSKSRFEHDRFHKATTKTKRELMAFARVHRRQMNIMGMSTRLISAMSLVVAVVSVMLFNADIATVFLILSYTSNIVEQLFQFGNNSLRNYNRAFGDSIEMIEIISLTPAVLDPEAPEKPRISRGLVSFEHVGFTHDGADGALFNDFSLRIKPGEKVGLVGHSGSGKTTFTRLLLRFSDIQTGAIRIDGQDIAHITQEDLRHNIAYVPQEPLLFHRTISENIGYGSKHPDIEQIKAAAKLSHADEFISQLPQGYETLVGERGVKLSGGQRQRIAIARAMLKNAPILLLDEATSALDSESEVLIQDALWKLMEGRTAIVIAHRLSTIQKMDRIIVLDNGKIVEEGSHKELLALNSAYAKLWAHQSGGFLEE